MVVDKQNLQVAMANKCMNAADLCRSANLHYQTYRHLIEGRGSKTKTIGRIAAALGVDVTEIINFERESR